MDIPSSAERHTEVTGSGEGVSEPPQLDMAAIQQKAVERAFGEAFSPEVIKALVSSALDEYARPLK